MSQQRMTQQKVMMSIHTAAGCGEALSSSAPYQQTVKQRTKLRYSAESRKQSLSQESRSSYRDVQVMEGLLYWQRL